MRRGERMRPGAAYAVEAALSLLLALLPALALLTGGDGDFAGLVVVVVAWYIAPASAGPLAYFAARRGVVALLAALTPLVPYLAFWILSRLPPPGLSCGAMLLLGIVGACAGQETRKRAKGKRK